MLNAAITYHLQQNDSATSRDLIHNLYVDNVVSGTHCEEAAVDYFIQSRSILGNANFNSRSWASNSKQLNDMAHTHNVYDDTNPVKVLGLWWDTNSDTIFASPKQDAAMFSVLATKREKVVWIARLCEVEESWSSPPPLRRLWPVFKRPKPPHLTGSY